MDPFLGRRLCVSIVEPTRERAGAAVGRALGEGAAAEVRLDALEDVDYADASSLATVLEGRSGPILLTCRRPEDGGRRAVDDAVRVALLAGAARRYGAACDLEIDLADRLDDLGVDRDRLVLSHHDMASTPASLDALYERMTRVRASVYKIATYAARTADLVAHARLVERAVADGRRVVALAMGPKGVASRVLGPASGAASTFCSLERGLESAPGQPSLGEMRDSYRADSLGRGCAVTGLVGGRVDYSLSPALHNAAYAALGLDGVYVPFEVDDLPGFVDDVVRPAARRVPWRVLGVSVTNPFKERILDLVDGADATAARVGAANTVVVLGDGRIVAHNTDVEGAMAPLARAWGRPLAGARVAVVGAGGAARAVACGLADAGASVTVFARRPERAGSLAASFADVASAPLDELAVLAAGAHFDVLVNTTPAGTAGGADALALPERVPASALDAFSLVYDLVYNPASTPLLAEAERRGCATLGGLGMLVEQAALQFALWSGAPAPVAAMRDAAALALARA